MARDLPKFYVYEIWDPVENKCRYVGKGHGKRASDQADSDKIRNSRLRDLVIARNKDGIRIEPIIVYRHDLEAGALRKEMALISKYGREDIEPGGTLFNLSAGGQGHTGHGKTVVVADIPYYTIKEAAEAYDVSEYLVRTRLSKGWTPEEAVGLIDRPRTYGRSKPIDIGGVSYPSKSAACRALGVTLAAVIARLKRGWTIEQAFDVEKRLPKQNRPIIVSGKEFDSIKSAANHHGVSPENAANRMKLGWTPEEAFEVKRRIPWGDIRHSESEVLDVRKRAASGQTFKQIAEFYGIDPSSVSNICRGKAYAHYGGPIVSNRVTNRKPSLPDSVILEIREAKAGGATNKELAERYNVDDSSISNICIGKAYRHVGGPLAKGQRRLSKKEVIAIREAKAAGMSFKDIAKDFDLHPEYVRQVCKGKWHRDVGGPLI